ncbi:MAG: polysaccharide biosynthesis C-terminal domain-containing protein [bacterium]|nr:polysaccharide biosynthesis C-terminal domain-containing protein [bacterium]
MRLAAAGSRILAGRVGQVAANAAVVVLVAQRLGPAGQGHYSLTAAVTLLTASLLGGGMGLAAVPALRQGRIDPRRLMRAQFLWLGAMLLVLAGGALLVTARPGPAAWLAGHLGWRPGLGFVVAAAAAGILGFEIFTYNLLARGRLVVGSAVNGWRAAGHLGLVGVLVLLGRLTLETAVAAFAVAQVGGLVAIVLVATRDLRRPHVRRDEPDTADDAGVPPVRAPLPDRELPADLDTRPLWRLVAFNLRHGALGQLSAVAYFLLLRLDQGFLEHFRGAAEVGIYSLAVYVGELVWLLPGALTPLLVHSSAADATDLRRDRTAARAVRLGVGLTLAAALPLYIAAAPLLALAGGGQYADSVPALRALLPGIVAFAPGVVLAGDFIGRGRPHWNTQASALTVVINVVAALSLIPHQGAVGAAWASSLAYACGSAIMLWRFRRATGMSLRGLILGRHRRPLPR